MRLTNNLFLDLLLTVLFAFLIMIAFNFANIYYLRKRTFNKWYILAAAAVLFGVSLILLGLYPSTLWYGIPLAVSLFAFLWFIDLRRRVKTKKDEKQIVMRPKAKPNRARKMTNHSEEPKGPKAGHKRK